MIFGIIFIFKHFFIKIYYREVKVSDRIIKSSWFFNFFLSLMTRVKRRMVARQRRKRILFLAKGAIGSNSSLFRIAKQTVIKSFRYSYREVCDRKRQYRSLWIIRLNARMQSHGCNYSNFFNYLRQKKCLLNRKVLAQLSIYDFEAFQVLLNLF